MMGKFRLDVIMRAYKRALECEDGSNIMLSEGLALIICMLTNIFEDQKDNPDSRIQQLRLDISTFLHSQEMYIIGKQFIQTNEDDTPPENKIN